MEHVPLINGIEHSFVDIVIPILGVPSAGITAISYSYETEKEDNYGAGKYPVSRGYGQEKSTASITVLDSLLNALEKSVPTGKLTDIPAFDLPVIFLPKNGVLTTHVLKNVEFTKVDRKMKTGDKKFESELSLIVSHIQIG